MVSGWQGAGLGDLLQNPREGAGYPQKISDPETYRMLLRTFWELAYFIMVPTCLVSTVTGVIVDSFGDSRAKRQERRDALQSKCYVCGIAASDFRGIRFFCVAGVFLRFSFHVDASMASKSMSDTTVVTFAHHVTKEHNIEHYFQVSQTSCVRHCALSFHSSC